MYNTFHRRRTVLYLRGLKGACVKLKININTHDPCVHACVCACVRQCGSCMLCHSWYVCVCRSITAMVTTLKQILSSQKKTDYRPEEAGNAEVTQVLYAYNYKQIIIIRNTYCSGKQSAQTSKDFITALVLYTSPSHITIPSCRRYNVHTYLSQQARVAATCVLRNLFVEQCSVWYSGCK